MPPRKDLIPGTLYGRLTVLKFSHHISRKGKGQKKVWLCLCQCGAEIEIEQSSLVTGNTKSCGCLQKDIVRASRIAARLPWREKRLIEMERSYRDGAKRRGHEWKISSDVFREIVAQRCFYCNFIKVFNGIDRVDNGKGYVVDNLVPCCAICNKAKSTMSLHQFYHWITGLLCVGPQIPFYLYRIEDESGISGIGVVAVGSVLPSGKAVVEWLGEHSTTTIFENLEQVSEIHSHGGKTVVITGSPRFHYLLKGIQEP